MRAFVSVTILVVLGTYAKADSSAEQLYGEGQQAFDRGDYATAIARWQASYELSKRPLLLLNVAQAHRLAGDCASALSEYRRYVALDPTSEQRSLADGFIAELASKCGRPSPPHVDHALHSLENTFSTAPPLRAQPSDDGAEHPAGMFTMRRKVAIGAATVSAASLVTAIVLGTSANNKKNDAFTLCPDPQIPCADAGRAHDLTVSGHRIAIGADVMFGCAGAASIVAGVLWFTGASESPRRLAVVPTAHGVVMLGRF